MVTAALATVSLLIGTLIYMEQTAILCVLSMLPLAVLPISFAMSDPENVGGRLDREPKR